MSWPSRRDLRREMGLNDKDWKQASFLETMLLYLDCQRKNGINEKHAYYSAVAWEMFKYVFRTGDGHWYDASRKAMWCLVGKSPKRRRSTNLEVRITYYILQERRYLYIFSKLKGEPEERCLEINMLDPQQRKFFVDIVPWAAKKHPLVPPKHAAVRRVMELDIKKERKHNRYLRARRRAQNTNGPSPLRNILNQA
ncbi:23095655-a5a7-49a8-a54e-b11315d83506 [Sclerotinia trifoliorum]|uniref:23095655-a5a7-49a8-a54e-b11315d83506 n=1 Tax=Sclerotinia trifoliorum TaxID=28548 RepID=A0A8H2VUW6_9HELO|nr:23095655-a5a7-49a8-a54e-b11315d83506 [Sclerotinia trifoliorum]